MNQQIILSEQLTALDNAARRSVGLFSAETSGAVLYSGGVDSSILATLITKTSKRPSEEYWLYTLGLEGSLDTLQSSISRILPYSHLERIVKKVNAQEILDAARKVKDWVDCSKLSQFEDCVAFCLLCQGVSGWNKTITFFSANGPDELFCGYDRFRRIIDLVGYKEADLEIGRALQAAALLQEHVKTIGDNYGVTILEPFLEQEFVSFCREKIPIELKIHKGDDRFRKRIWRDYARYLGLTEEIASRPKKAMQYSMGIHKTVLSAVKQGTLTLELGSEKKESI